MEMNNGIYQCNQFKIHSEGSIYIDENNIVRIGGRHGIPVKGMYMHNGANRGIKAVLHVVNKFGARHKKWCSMCNRGNSQFGAIVYALIYRALVRGGARRVVAAPSFWDLIEFQKFYLSVDPYQVKKIFCSPKFKMLTRPLLIQQPKGIVEMKI